MNQYTYEFLARERIALARQEGMRGQAVRASMPARPSMMKVIVGRIRQLLRSSVSPARAAVAPVERPAAARPGLG